MTAFFLKKLAIFLTSSGLFEHIKNMILVAAAEDITSEEKRTKVIGEAKEYGETTKNFLINLVIEMAYSYLKINKEV